MYIHVCIHIYIYIYACALTYIFIKHNSRGGQAAEIAARLVASGASDG